MAVHEEYLVIQIQGSMMEAYRRHDADEVSRRVWFGGRGGGDRSLLALHFSLGRAGQTEPLRLSRTKAVTRLQPILVQSKHSQPAQAHQTNSSHRNHYSPWPLCQRRPSEVESVHEKWENTEMILKRRGEKNKKQNKTEKNISSRHEKNQRWQINCSFLSEALICTVLWCSDVPHRNPWKWCLLKYEVGTSTAWLNSICTLTYTAYGDLKFQEWWLYFINKTSATIIIFQWS